MNWKLAKRVYSLAMISIIILSSIASMFLWESVTKTEGESPLNVISTITGSNQGDYFGWNVSWAGDVNFDGYEDIIVGAPYTDCTPGDWWDINWTYRRNLIFDNSAQSEALENFPVLITLNPLIFDYSRAKSDGTDLRFIDADGLTELKYHIEKWNTSGFSYVWVNVTNIEAGSFTDHIWMYYGNPAASNTQNQIETYEDKFKAVWHLRETPTGIANEIKDSTSNLNHGTSYGSMDSDDQVKGKTDGSLEFDGVDDYIVVGDRPNLDFGTSDFTIEAWVCLSTSLSMSYPTIVCKGAGAENVPGYWFFWYDSSGFLRLTIGDGTSRIGVNSATSIKDDSWHYVVAVADRDGNGMIYIDGELDAIDDFSSKDGQSIDTASGMDISDSSGNSRWDGILDEIRISNVARSDDWVRAQYLSMNNSFITMGAEENHKIDAGAAYLFFGYPGRSDDINASNANATIYGSYTIEHFGWSVACAGNLNDDAYDDIIIGAPGFGLNKGRAYVFHGRTSLAWGSIDDAEIDADVILTGENEGDKFGCSVSGVGDVSIENHFDDWLYRKKITIQASQVTGDLTDFPVLLNITDLELKKGARFDGFDIVFTASDGKTKLAHEIERYNSSSGELIAWIKIPLLSSTANTDIFMYYGNNESYDQSNPTEVWESNYVGVWHLGENPSDTPPQFRDSTSFDNHGSVQGSFNADDQVEGKIDGSIDSTGTDEYINVLDSTSLDSLDITGEFSYYAWIYPRDLAWYSIMGNDKIRFCKDDALYVFLYNPGSQSAGTGTAVIKPNEWQQVATTYNRFTQEVILYHNGIQVGTGNVANADLDSPREFHIADSRGWYDYFDGIIDEVRVSNVARSAEWITTSYNNQNNTGAFYTVGGEEIIPKNWKYRKSIIINSDEVTADLVDFPVLIDIMDKDILNHARGDGYDIVFTDLDGKTKLDHEIESYNSSTGELVAWVEIPYLSSSSDTQIFMYYGNSDSSYQSNPEGVWDSNYKMVHHLQEFTGTHYDSTSYDTDGTWSDSNSLGNQDAQGKINGANDFDGVDDYIQLPDDITIISDVSEVTLEAWVKLTSLPSVEYDIISLSINSGSPTVNSRACIDIASTDEVEVGGRAPDSQASIQQVITTTSPMSAGDWYHIVGVIDYANDNIIIYVNGQSQTTSGTIDFTQMATDNTVSSYSNIGTEDDMSKDFLYGILDELRVSTVIRSADWIATEFNNQNDTDSFYTIGKVEIIPENWRFYKPIIIQSSQVTADLTDFPVMIDITDTDLRDKARSDGFDIVFTGSDGRTRLDHEIERYDCRNGELIAWVRIPFLSSTSNTVIYMYYGNPDADIDDNSEGVWRNGYVAVYHMVEETGSIENSASSTNDGTRINTPSRTTGVIGFGQEFSGGGSDDMFNLSDLGISDGLHDQLTLSCWANIDDSALEAWGRLISKRNDANNDNVYSITFDDQATNKDISFHVKDDSGVSSIAKYVWVYITFTYDGFTKVHYQNGTFVRDDTGGSGGAWQASSAPVTLGARWGETQNFGGILDEVRISIVARSAEWVETEYNNQKNPSLFYTLGSEESFGDYDDVLVGAYGFNNEKGRAYLYCGSNLFYGSLSAKEAKVIINGSIQGDRFGWAVSGGGNLNKGCFEDIIIGAPGRNSDSGTVYVFYGNKTLTPIREAANSDVIIAGGIAGYEFGYSISNMADLNNNGYDDVIVGSPGNNGDTGAVYVFYGSETMNPAMNVMDANVAMYGEDLNDRFGTSVGGTEDMSGDGVHDVFVGAPYYDNGIVQDSGAIYVFEGGTSMDGTADWSHKGVNANEHLGFSISHAGDIDCDGWMNILVGAPENGESGMRAGKAYILSIAVSIPTITEILATPENQIIGGNVNITCNVSSYIGITSVFVNITLPQGGYIQIPMIRDSGNNWFYNSIYIDVGQYQFTIWANDTIGNWNESAISQFEVVNRNPIIYSEQVDPNSGFYDTWFNFTATYMDLDNHPPNIILVNITGQGVYNLTEFDPLDIDFTDGKEYYLNISNIDVGSYNFHFAANDTIGDWIEIGTLNFEVLNRAPTLSQEEVNPTTGYFDTWFNFTVVYTDLDNHPPDILTINITDVGVFNLFEVNNSDTDYTDGKEYCLNRILSTGSYSFHFGSNDSLGLWANETLQIYNPNVNPKNGFLDVTDRTGEFSDEISLSAILLDDTSNPIAGENIAFYIDTNGNGVCEATERVGVGFTNIDGSISITYTAYLTPNAYEFSAIYTGSDNYIVDDDTATLTINPKPGTLTAPSHVVDEGAETTLTAILQDGEGNPIADMQVSFYIDKNKNGIYEGSEFINTTSTSTAGIASIMYTVILTPENYGIWARYEGLVNYTVTEVEGLLTVRNIGNRPPIILGIVPNQIKPEDSLPWTVDLTQYELDIEDTGPNLKWYLTGIDTNIYSVTGMNSSDDILTFIPVENKYGNDNVMLWLSDSDGNKVSQELWVNITSVNDPPYFTPTPPNLIVHYDDPSTNEDDPDPWDYTYYVHDVETNVVDLKIITSEPIVDTGNGYTEVDGLKVTFHYPQKMVGKNILVTLTLSDGTDTAQTMILVNVTSNWVPKLEKKLPNVVIEENSTLYNAFNLDDYFSDRDNDVLFYSSGYSHLKVNINDNNSVDITALGNWTGIETVTFRAKDPIGAISEDTITVTVIPINDPPEISGVPDLVVHFDYSYAFDFSPYILDVDNYTSELVIWTSESTDYISIQQNNNLGIVVNYPESFNGITIPLTIFVSDGIDIASQDIQIRVTSDFPPELIYKLPDVFFDEDSVLENAFKLNDFFLDIDGDALFFTNFTKFINVTIKENLSVDFSALENWYGSEMVTFRATDPTGAIIEDMVLVVVVPVNDAPQIRSIPKQEKNNREQWVLDLTQFIYDVDNDASRLIISAESEVGQDYIKLVGNILVFQYPDEMEEDIVTITVSDGELETSRSFIVSISNSESLAPSIWDLIPWNWVFFITLIGLICAVVFYKKKSSYRVYEAFLIHEKGLPIAHISREESSELEDVIVSGMFTAVQDFIYDTFSGKTSEDEWELDEMKFGENKILIERSRDLYLAVIFKGNGNTLRNRVKKLLFDIDIRYGKVLMDWSGDMTELKGIRIMAMDLISKKVGKEMKSEPMSAKPHLESIKEEFEVVKMSLEEGEEVIKKELDELLGDFKGIQTKEFETQETEEYECPVCGKELDSKTTKCSRCGVEFADMNVLLLPHLQNSKEK